MPVWLVNAGSDIRHAFKMIARMPAFAAVVILSIGMGIGANTVVFSWVQARILQPIPAVAHSAGFHLVEAKNDAGMYTASSWLEYRDLRERLTSFPELFAFRMVPLYVGETGRVERVFGLLVSDNYFSALGLRPAIGRFLRPDDVASAGGAPVAVIAHGLWQSRFNGREDAIGKTVRVNGRELTVIGVTPRAFQGTVVGLNFEMWLPATLAPVMLTGSRELENRGSRGYSLMGRFRPSVTREQAQSELDAAMRQLAQAYPDTNATITAEVLRQSESPRGPQRLLNAALAILQAVMLLLLLAVCGNMANLVLARASARQKEMSVRLALGAGPWRIASLLLTENIVLAVLGAGLGAAFAVWGTQALKVLPLSGLPLRFQTSVDGLGLVFAMGLGVLCGAIFGAAPALQLARLDPQTVFREGARTAGRSRTRNVLMALQVALASIVLIVAGLFLRSFMETRTSDPGFRREGVLLAAYDLAGRNAGPEFVRGFPSRLLEKLRALPGVEAAAISSSVPLDIHGLPGRVFMLEGRARSDGEFDQALSNTVTPEYFTVMGIALHAGTDFANLRDPSAAPQAIVNEAFVQRHLDGAADAALGRRIQARGREYTITGVVATSLSNAFGEPPTPVIYFSYRDGGPAQGEMHLRTRPGAETAIAAEVRRVVREIDPDVPVFNVRTLSQHVDTNLVFRRVPAQMFAVLGPMMLLLAAIGIYAVVAYTASLRRTEIGVRLALGATPPRLVGQFVGQSMTVIGTGALVGWLLAFVVAVDVVSGRAVDVPVFAGVPALLLLVAATACWLPARRAARARPVDALRSI